MCSIPFSVAPVAERKLFNGSMEANLEGCLVVLFLERCILKKKPDTFFLTDLSLSLSVCVCVCACVSVRACICASEVSVLSGCFWKPCNGVEGESSTLEIDSF